MENCADAHATLQHSLTCLPPTCSRLLGGTRRLEKPHPSLKLLLFILNHLADPQGDPKCQIQVPKIAPLLSSVIADPA
jgi:hypothetical protein